MVSARVEGYVKFYVLTASGARHPITGASTFFLGPIGVGWKSDGAVETVQDMSKWNKMPAQGPAANVNKGSKLLMTIEIPATKTLDSTDMQFQIPVTVYYPDGSKGVRITTTDDWNIGDVNTKYQNLVIPATTETPCGECGGNTGEKLQLGGSSIWMDFQDSA